MDMSTIDYQLVASSGLLPHASQMLIASSPEEEDENTQAGQMGLPSSHLAPGYQMPWL